MSHLVARPITYELIKHSTKRLSERYFNDDNTPDISTDRLHERLIQFFSENRKDKKNLR